ncbi:MAG: septal ring lytic transglycosylase RlpA family protein [Chitinophagaceae bacterium]|nr:septal ring lytic transglycosylase RlpA family protein [Chitinophagaceae bacterium]
MRKLCCLAIFFISCLSLRAQHPDSSAKAQPVAADTAQINYRKVGQTTHRQSTIYNTDLDGSRTASGEMFHNARLTGASNDFDFNTWLLVTNPKNQKKVIIRINDRLPKKLGNKGIGLRLSRSAADSIGVKADQVKLNIDVIVPVDSLSFVNTQSPAPKPVDTTTPNTFRPKGKALTGIASFYSYNLDGTMTSTGERYRNARFTAASNNFKLNTWVLVTNLNNKKSVIVRINDHMHPRMKKKGRVVDLSREAAKQLDFIDRGLTRVKVQPVEFIFSPEVKKQLDSLQADSTRQDSIKTEPKTEPAPEDNSKTGIASFYSANLDGTLTATGETYRNNRMSAASNDFDLNTWVRITNLNNNKSVVLRINDRMHPKMQKKGRVVDLSRIAAKKLDFMKDGLAKVKVEIVNKEDLQ